jgi:hypothetical protein
MFSPLLNLKKLAMFGAKAFISVFLLVIFVSNSLQINVECEYKISHGWKTVDDPYGCFITTLNVQSKTTVTSATGNHLYGNSDGNVKALNIYGGICEVIPSGLGTIFPSVELFTVWNATLKIVTNKEIQQFPNLRELWLYVNELEYLESNLFEYNSKVEYIHFNSNKIKYIGGNFFNFLPNLQKASFWYNLCITGEATDAASLEVIKNEAKEKCSLSGAGEAIGSNAKTIGMYESA